MQVFEDPTEKSIEFSPIPIWIIGEENKIEYTVPLGYEEAESDWIGVFKVCLKKREKRKFHFTEKRILFFFFNNKKIGRFL